MSEKLILEVGGAGLDPTTISRVEADTEVDVRAKSLTIERISAAIELKSKLKDGSLDIDLTPKFDWGFNISKAHVEGASEDLYRKKLKALGLDDSQVQKVMDFLQEDVVPELPPPDLVSLPDVKGKKTSPVRRPEELRERLSLPLPDKFINLSPTVNMNGVDIKDIQLQEKTRIESSNINTQGLKLDDFVVETAAADGVSFEKAEISRFAVKPLQLNELTLRNLNAAVSVPKLGSTNIPVTIETKEGTIPIEVTLINWKKRWRAEASFHVLWKKVTVWAEFGFDLKIVLKYTWQLSLLKVVITLKNAFLNTISISLKMPKIIFSGISVGLANVARLVCRKAQSKKSGILRSQRNAARR